MLFVIELDRSTVAPGAISGAALQGRFGRPLARARFAGPQQPERQTIGRRQAGDGRGQIGQAQAREPSAIEVLVQPPRVG
jgi:hypothetical protein